MIPLRDINPTKRTPIITILLIGINAVVFFYELSLSQGGLDRFTLQYGLVPSRVTSSLTLETGLTFITSMFLHGDWLHIGGNMLYLWIFGNNVEDRLGIVRFIIFYFMSGIVAGLAQVMIDPQSSVPMIGASGAIAGVLGGYIVLWPRARIQTLVIFWYFIRIIELSAAWVLGFWFVLQLLNGALSIGVTAQTGGVAFFAHIGGFIFGVLLIKFFTMGRARQDWWMAPPGQPRSPNRWWD